MIINSCFLLSSSLRGEKKGEFSNYDIMFFVISGIYNRARARITIMVEQLTINLILTGEFLIYHAFLVYLTMVGHVSYFHHQVLRLYTFHILIFSSKTSWTVETILVRNVYSLFLVPSTNFLIIMKCDKNLSSQKKLFHFNGMFLG
jgi:hypothetical protein